MDTFLKAIQNNQFETLAISAGIVFIIWMYKEIRNSYIETEKMNNERANKALEIYAELQIELSNYLINKDCKASLDMKLAKSYSFLPQKLLDKLMEWRMNSQEEENLKEFLEELKKEILRIKRIQKDTISYKPGDSLDSIGHFLHSIKANSYVQPLILFAGIFVVVSSILMGAYFFLISDVNGKIFVLFLGLNIFCYFIFILLFIDILTEGRFKHGFKNWLFLILLVVLPAATMLSWNKWFVAVSATVLLWTYLIFILKRSVRRS